MEKWYIYILQSKTKNKYYIGQTKDINDRLRRHNFGLVKSTKYGIPWEIIRVEEYDCRSDAYRRERQIKRYKSGEAFKKLIDRSVA